MFILFVVKEPTFYSSLFFYLFFKMCLFIYVSVCSVWTECYVPVFVENVLNTYINRVSLVRSIVQAFCVNLFPYYIKLICWCAYVGGCLIATVHLLRPEDNLKEWLSSFSWVPSDQAWLQAPLPSEPPTALLLFNITHCHSSYFSCAPVGHH